MLCLFSLISAFSNGGVSIISKRSRLSKKNSGLSSMGLGSGTSWNLPHCDYFWNWGLVNIFVTILAGSPHFSFALFIISLLARL